MFHFLSFNWIPFLAVAGNPLLSISSSVVIYVNLMADDVFVVLMLVCHYRRSTFHPFAELNHDMGGVALMNMASRWWCDNPAIPSYWFHALQCVILSSCRLAESSYVHTSYTESLFLSFNRENSSTNRKILACKYLIIKWEKKFNLNWNIFLL